MIPMLYCDAITDAMTKGLGQQRACVRYNIVTSAMDVALLFLWLPKYGISGYYASFLVTHVINFGLSLRRLLKCSGTHLSVFRPVLALVALVLAVRVGMRTGMLLYLLLFAALLVLFHVVSGEDLRWIKGLIRKK